VRRKTLTMKVKRPAIPHIGSRCKVCSEGSMPSHRVTIRQIDISMALLSDPTHRSLSPHRSLAIVCTARPLQTLGPALTRKPNMPPMSRSSKACTECRQVKLRCDSQPKFPDPCTRCQSRALKCNFEASFESSTGAAHRPCKPAAKCVESHQRPDQLRKTFQAISKQLST
jgi:hypothetical protein